MQDRADLEDEGGQHGGGLSGGKIRKHARKDELRRDQLVPALDLACHPALCQLDSSPFCSISSPDFYVV